jgi:FtsP/CotA-like multicopper oxidase with cupredoxin domain
MGRFAEKEEFSMLTRRQLIVRGAAGTAGAMFGGTLLEGSALAATSVARCLRPYVDPMPLLVDNAINATGGGKVSVTAALISRKVHRDLPATTLFGYLRPGSPGSVDPIASYLGPAIVAQSGVPISVDYINHLAPDDYLRVFTNGGSSYLQFAPFPEVRTMTHLHGGFNAAIDDGNPYAQPGAFRSGGTQSVTYPNEQPASLLWYHDHYLGDTRMNVVAGLAGGYLLRDGFDSGSNPLLPGPIGQYELPIVVQDRQFNRDGSLLYPTDPASEHGPWIGEYFGDVMLVNGKIWPNLVVEPAVYRFRVLNGCNARILSLNIGRVPMYIIGAEGGLLPINPVATDKLVMASAERFDVICDFRRFAGQTLFMTNSTPSAPVSTPAPPLTPVMRISVKQRASSGAPMRIPRAGSLPDNPNITALTSLGPPKLSGGSVPGRMITLNEVGADTSSWKLNLNAHPYGENPSNPFVEALKWNSVEDWYYVNATPDTHPMHTHLFTFKVIGRYNYDAAGYAAKYGGPNGVPQLDVSTLAPFLESALIPPGPSEAGFKDTVKANPGQVTVVRAQYSLPSTALNNKGQLVTPQKYVHHCHIAEHEDNDQMERFAVQP